VADDEPVRRDDRAHHALPAKLLGSAQRLPDVRDLDVEQRAVLVALAAADATADPGAVVGGEQLDEALVVRLGHLLGHCPAGVELPPEQISEEASQSGGIGADDLEVHDGLSHVAPF
jgi:hypothetical protein